MKPKRLHQPPAPRICEHKGVVITEAFLQCVLEVPALRKAKRQRSSRRGKDTRIILALTDSKGSPRVNATALRLGGCHTGGR